MFPSKGIPILGISLHLDLFYLAIHLRLWQGTHISSMPGSFAGSSVIHSLGPPDLSVDINLNRLNIDSVQQDEF